MTKNRGLILLTMVAIVVLASLAAISYAALPGVSNDDAKKIMPVSEIRRGMRGYGLTVFHGTKIEKFDVEVLGILKKMNTGKDLILVRVGGGPITTRNTGIIAGMSGSPCYIDGRLIGAISYGSGFAKEPVGMITPAADMLEAWDSNLPKHADGYSSLQNLTQPVKISGKSVDDVVIDSSGDARDTGIDDGTLHMQPLMTPLMVSGLSARSMERLSQILSPFHIRPTAGPGGAEDSSVVSPDLVPGAAIGMSLVRGDIDMTAIGTVTYRSGNRIVAFGHPMLGIGAIDAPMTTAYVADVLSSYNVSTKMASPIKMVGRIFQDRPWSIAGSIGSMPATIPATIQVNDESTRRSKTFHVQVINHPLLASNLLTMVTGEAISEMHPTPGDATANVSYEVTADQIGKVKRSNVFFDPASIDTVSLGDVGGLLQIISANRFYPLDIKSLNVKVDIVNKRNTATIDRIFVKKSEYQPGETMDVGVVLRPYKGDRITKTLSIKIPATATDGKLTLVVRGGGTRSAVAAPPPSAPGASASGDEPEVPVIMPTSNPDLANADNVKQLVDKYLDREKNNDLVVQLQMHGTAINVSGEKLNGLPNAIADIMKSSRNSGLKMERDEFKQRFAQDLIVSGLAQVTIDVKRSDLKENKQTPVVSAPGSDGPDSSDTPESMGAPDFDPADYSGDGPRFARTATDSLGVVVTDQSDAPDEDKSVQADNDSAPDKDAAKPSKDNGPGPVKIEAKTVVRQPKFWSQRSQSDFAKGKFSGVAASSENKLEMVPTLRKVAETPEQFVWSVVPASDGVYAGTGELREDLPHHQQRRRKSVL